MKLLSDQQVVDIEQHLVRVLDRTLHAEGLSRLNESIRAYVLAGGKRIRPQLCVWTYERVQGQGVRGQGNPRLHSPDPSPLTPLPLMDLACAWELFHAFLLIHDDIIDAAEQRRDQLSLHRQLASLDSNCSRFGSNLGIVAGDLLFSAAMSLWHEVDLPGQTYRDALRLFSRVSTITGFGQAIDICQSHVPLDEVSEETLLREYHWKTAAYTFEGPMLTGAILASATEGARQAISRFALALGQAYQLQNDLVDLSSPVHEGCDLIQGKRTITLMRARSAMTPGARQKFDQRLEALQQANGQAVHLTQALRDEVIATGAPAATRRMIGEFLDTARASIDDPALDSHLSTSMRTLLESLESRYFASV